MDGTFTTAPSGFLQLFTIHALITNEVLSLVYILAQRKLKSTYMNLFGELKKLAISEGFVLNPEVIMADFEKGARTAAKFHFPNVEIRGCFSYFRQCISRKANKLGLKPFYRHESYRDFITSFGTLAMVPPSQINNVMPMIQNIMPDDSKCRALLQYVSSEWVNNEQMPISSWNHFDHYDNRSNNSVEGFHAKIKRMFNIKKPNIYLLIKFIKKLHCATLIDYERLKQNICINVQSKAEREKDLRIELMKEEYRRGITTLDHYFDQMTLQLRFPYEAYNEADEYILS